MKVLIVTSSPISTSNGFGLTFNNIFSDIPDLQFANIYCKPGNLENSLDMVGFQITESSLLKNLKNKYVPTGKVVENHKSDAIQMTNSEQKTFDKARTLRWQVLFWVRDFIWKIGRWKSPELVKFVDDFKPDIIFQPIYGLSNIHEIAQFAKQHTNVPMVCYILDDNYSLRQFRFSPLFWIDRLWKRAKVKKTINMSELLYTISNIQKQECEKVFKPKCKILTKCADFPEKEISVIENKEKINIIYAGNLGIGRWKSVGLLAKAVQELNCEGFNVSLDIYSATPQTKSMQKALNRGNSSKLHKSIPYSEVLKLQNEADILVHAEGLSLKSRFTVHQSFSTKIVDLLQMGKCIFAIGTYDEASINYLKKNDAAVVATNYDEVYNNLKMLVTDTKTISKYSEKAYKCGAKNHQKSVIQKMLMEDLKKAASTRK